MLPSNFRTLLAEVVTHRRRKHHTEGDKAVREYTYEMVRRGNDRSSAFNDGKVKMYCEAFEKYAADVWGGMQKVLAGGFEVYPGCEDDLIAFLKESLAAVCEADTKSLFAQKNVAVHKVVATHLAQCKPRFEFRCRAVTEKLTTEIKIFVNQLRAIKEKEVHGVTIEGRQCQVAGFDEQRNLVLADGQRYIFELLNYNPLGQPREEPDGDVFGWPLLEAVKLQQWERSWKWNGEEQLLDQWVKSEVEKFGGESQAFEQPEFFKRRLAKSRLDALPPVEKAKVRGVAWFKHDDGTGGWYTPILLKGFRRLPSSAKPGRSKTKKARQPKPVARFEKNYAQVVISQRNKEPHTEGIPRELRVMIRVIIQAGGRLAGPELKSQVQKALAQKNADNFRPDKLLRSKVGTMLQKARLLGSKDGKGAITVYWAKKRAK